MKVKPYQLLLGVACLCVPGFLYLGAWQHNAADPTAAVQANPCPPCQACPSCMNCKRVCAPCAECAQCALCATAVDQLRALALPGNTALQAPLAAEPVKNSAEPVKAAVKLQRGGGATGVAPEGDDGCDRRAINEELRRRSKAIFLKARNTPGAQVVDCTIHNPCGSGCMTHRFVACFERALSLGAGITYDSSYTPEEVNLKLPGDLTMGLYTVPWDSRPGNTTRIGDVTNGEPNRLHKWLVADGLMDDLRRCYRRPGMLVAGVLEEEFLFPVWENFGAGVQKYLENPPKCDYAVHIRRGDKINLEALLHHTTEYMQAVDRWERPLWNFQSRYGVRHGKTVCMRSDDTSVVQDVQNKYWAHYDYEFGNVRKNIASGFRRSRDGVENAFLDYHILASADKFVGTYSSAFSRVVLERMAARQKDVDIYAKGFSVDDPWYGIGWEFWPEVREDP